MAFKKITIYEVNRGGKKGITRWTVEIKEAVKDMWPNEDIIHR